MRRNQKGSYVKVPEPLWQILHQQPNLLDPWPFWQKRLGQEAPALCFLQPMAYQATNWPCGARRWQCRRELVYHAEEDVVAVCRHAEGRCATEAVPVKQTYVQRLDEAAIWGAVARAVGLRTSIEAMGAGIWRLGLRVIEGGPSLEVFASRQVDEGRLRAISQNPIEVGALCVLLTPLPLPAPLRRLATDVEVYPLALQAAQVLPTGTIEVDLDAFFLEHTQEFANADPVKLLSTKRRLIFHPEKRACWLDGKQILIPKDAALQWRFLDALIGKLGRTLVRTEMIQHVWSNEKAGFKDWGAAARRLRGEIGKASIQVFEEDHWPIMTVEGDDATGGYALTLRPEEVGIWSRLPSLSPPQKQTIRKKIKK